MLVRIGRHRRHTANHTWNLDLRRRRLFVKANPNRAEAQAERAGHSRIQGIYPVPSLLCGLTAGGWAVHVYERWTGLDVNRGLLLDEITYADRTGDMGRLSACLDSVLDRYDSVIARTVRPVTNAETIGKLYGDRAAARGRLENYYGRNASLRLPHHSTATLHLADLRRTWIVVNGTEHTLDFYNLLEWLRSELRPDRSVWAAVTQGDPTDFNIGWSPARGPIWFDYDTAGLNSLAGEFACFLVYQRLHGAWLTPAHNPEAYRDHPAALAISRRFAPEVRTRHSGDRVTIAYRFAPSPARRFLMRRYLDRLVYPLATLLHIDDPMDWLRPYLIMRILGVYNLCAQNSHDAALSLALLVETLDRRTNLDGLLESSESEGVLR